jgi:hypothetical protein
LLLTLMGFSFGIGPVWSQDEGLVAPVYGWHAYTSHKTVTEISVMGDSVYAITVGGLIRHNLATHENVLFSTVDGLSSVDPSTVLADPETRRVFVGFKYQLL